jgi:hypothetical protein
LRKILIINCIVVVKRLCNTNATDSTVCNNAQQLPAGLR